MATTFRVNLRSGCKAVLDTLQAANPTLLAHVYDHRPASYRTPCAFVDNVIVEPSITHTAGLRGRDLVARVYIVHKVISNDQTADEQDVLVDKAVDAFTAAPNSASSTTLMEPISVDADEVTDGDATYAASVLSIRGRVLEGRN